MLRGTTVGLRARHDDDLPILLAELFDDPVNTSRAEAVPWRPISPGSVDHRLKPDETNEKNAVFSVVELEGGKLIGDAALWGIDLHNRLGHIGMSLLPDARGKGYGTDVVATLCHYGFVLRGLHRVQIETLVDNDAMQRAAEHNGFQREGHLRSSAWVMGEFLDEVYYGLLAEEWSGRAAD